MNERRDSRGRILRIGETQSADGRYVFTYKDSIGKRQKAYSWRLLPSDRTPKGRRDDKCLREKEEAIQADLAAGLNTAGKRQTVCELCEAYVRIKAPMVRDNTRAAYQTTLGILRGEPFGHRRIGDVTKSDAKMFLIHLQRDERRSYSAIQNVRGVLNPAFESAVEDDFIRHNPFDFELKSVVKNDTQRRDALTAEEMNDFLGWVRGSKCYSKYFEVFYLLFFTGLRVSELCGLTLGDIHYDGHYLNVERQLQRTRSGEYYISPTKTSSGARKVPLTPDVEACLRAIAQKRPRFDREPVVKSDDGRMSATGFLLFDKDGRVTVAQHWENHFRWAAGAYKKEMEQEKGIKIDKSISPHVARHTFCSLRVKEGMQPKTLQMVMGHSSIRTTLGWYTHLTDDDVVSETLAVMTADKALISFDAVTDGANE
ncbi:MAG: site-specific integrase [Eggerthellaceae bacterium]|nr:site-specific integrase [Eggerthellaceae bacterium]